VWGEDRFKISYGVDDGEYVEGRDCGDVEEKGCPVDLCIYLLEDIGDEGADVINR
jgi:hypothetical protein